MDETADPAYWDEFVRNWTELIRDGADAIHGQVRLELVKKGFRPERTTVAWFVPEGRGLYNGIVISEDGGVLEFWIQDPSRPAPRPRPVEWRDVTESYQSLPFPAAIEAGLRLQRENARQRVG